MVSGLRDAMKAAELAGLAATLAVRDAISRRSEV